MKNAILVFCQTHDGALAEISKELLSKGRTLAAELQAPLAAVVVGAEVEAAAAETARYGAQCCFVGDDPRLAPYTTLPYARLVVEAVKRCEPQILLLGATGLGRDLAPRVAAMLGVGCTADCTELCLGDYTSPEGRHYEQLLYQIRPSFVGNQLTTIIAPDSHPQMATVREGVMRLEAVEEEIPVRIEQLDTHKVLNERDFLVTLLSRSEQPERSGLKSAKIVVAGGYGACHAATFDKLNELAELLGAEIGGTRAAVDAGFVPHERMIGQTGRSVAPQLYLAFGISGQVQHTVGIERAGMIVAINTDPDAPINRLADVVITGDAREVAERMIQILKEVRR